MPWIKPSDRADDVFAQVVHGRRLREQYEAGGNVSSLDRSIEVLEDAAGRAARIRSPDLLAALAGLGLSLRERARVGGTARDLEAAVTAHEEAYRLVDPTSPHRAGMAGNLAGSLRQRWELTGRRADLERAVWLYREAVRSLPSDAPYASDALSNLANGLSAWYPYTRDPADLDEAVEAAEAALTATRFDSTSLSLRMANAAGVLRQRGELTGHTADLSKAVELAESALAATVPGSAGYADRYGTLTSVMACWYTFSGDLAALDRAVELGLEGLDWAHGDQIKPLLVNLSAAYRLRYDVYEQPDDLQRALGAVHAVLNRFAVAPTPDRVELLQSAASLHKLAAKATGDRGQLDIAETLLDEAAAFMPTGSSAAAMVAAQRGNLAHHRWQLGDPRATLDEAVKLLEVGLVTAQESSVDQSDRARLQYQLATTLADRGVSSGREVDLNRADELLAELGEFELHGFDIDLTAPAAHARGLLAAYQGRDIAAAEAFAEVLASVRQRFAKETVRRHREGVLGAAQGVSAQAAAALMRAGRTTEAVVALELGQAVLASEALAREAIDLHRVATVDPELAGRLRVAGSRLTDAERTDRSDSTQSEKGNAALTAASADFDACLMEVRRHSQLADVLTPPGLPDVLAAAGDLPLVYLAADRRHGCAFLIRPGAGSDVIGIQLPDLTTEALGKRLAGHLEAVSVPGPGSSAELESFLSWLGTAAIEPWLEELDPVGYEAVRIVPVGMLALCPLHAANLPGSAGGPAEPLLERIAVSFAPNARAITLARNRAAARSTVRSVFVVGDPQPVKAAALPYARAEAERVAAAYPGSTLLTGRQATLERVHHLLGTTDLVHLACHGQALPMSPRASSLLFANDERLTMADLVQSGVSARLVLLSACESSVPGLALPDEVVALPTGLVQAGAAGVIGSLWRVPDESAAALMVRVHELFQTGVRPAEALAGAQRWLRQATNQELADWWSMIAPRPRATGRSALQFWSAGKPFADPRHWAGFVHIGA